MTKPVKEKMQHHLDNLTKPKGSLGDLEDLALRLAKIQGRVPPRIDRRICVVFAGDHGIVDEGVSLYPREVTTQMVLNFAGGGAAINVMAKHCGMDLQVVDAGIAGDIDDDKVINKKVGRGTRNFAKEEAMTEGELDSCLNHGRELAARIAREGYDLVCIGDMGIGNTTTAAALLAANGLSLDSVVDRGTGIDDTTLKHKREVISTSLKKYGPFSGDKKIACVIDGFPVTTGAYLAWRIDSSVSAFLFAGHKSKVKGHIVILEAMELEPILDLNMRLGEGTGAALGGFVISMGANIACEMSSFESAGVSRSEGDEKDY
jgi:nicotinate-nucleotide--dimethylbenzimidazole phosphoribosyltransferase